MRTLFCIFFCLIHALAISQEVKPPKASSIDVNYFYGNIANHNSDILHLITGHPEGVVLSWNRKTFGEQKWQQRFNYPDLGVSFSYQDFKNEYLGENYAVYGHYNFYFLKRHLMLRVGQGLAYATNPYDGKENPKNVAFGSRLMSSTYLMLNFKKERLFKSNFGIQSGLSLMHYSNGNVKAPNTSVNTITLNLGLVYTFQDEEPFSYIKEEDSVDYKEPIAYNIVFRGGINQSDVIGTKQYPFYILSFYADKRIGRMSALQLGTEVFFSTFLKEDIKYNVAAFPDRELDPDTDYKRIGVFLGHELFINKLSFITQLGYYAYYPYAFEKRVYGRIGLKRYFGKRIFGALTLKAHGAAAEAVEFGLGVRL